MYSFKDFIAVNYTPGEDELVSYQALKRKKRDMPFTTVESAPEDESADKQEVDEVLSVSQRIKARQNIRRKKARVKLGARRAARRIATPARLKTRAARAARNILFKRISGGKSKKKMPLAARAAIERRLEARKGALKIIAKRLLPKVRARDRQKFRKKSGKK